MDERYQNLRTAIIKRACDDYIAGMQYINENPSFLMETFIKDWIKVAAARISGNEDSRKNHIAWMRTHLKKEMDALQMARNAVKENESFFRGERFVFLTDGLVDGEATIKALQERAKTEFPHVFVKGKETDKKDRKKIKARVVSEMKYDYLYAKRVE